jgi:hypothetical protein
MGNRFSLALMERIRTAGTAVGRNIGATLRVLRTQPWPMMVVLAEPQQRMERLKIQLKLCADSTRSVRSQIVHLLIKRQLRPQVFRWILALNVHLE